MDYKKAWEELRGYVDGKISDWGKAQTKAINEKRGKDENICFEVKLHLGYMRAEMTRIEKEADNV